MDKTLRKYFGSHGRRVLTLLMVLSVAFAIDLGLDAYAQTQKKKKAQAIEKETTFTRPKPTRPIKPEVPSANRYRQDKVFLEYADSLFKPVENRVDTVEKQVVKGNVKFRQAGMWLFCDSAYYFPELNSLDAFGHVRMEQGDTLFVYSDRLYYEGNDRMAKLKNGPSCPKVRLVNKEVTLTTDSLDYDLNAELGWYSKWGTIDDKVNTLTSLYGEYSPGTKIADFYHDVVLVNNEDGYTMYTDTLRYNTATHIARIASKTEIQGANDTIITTRGFYDTNSGNAELLARSILIHRDSNNNVVTLEGDSIIYNKNTRISRAYMFRNPLRHGQPMILTDTAHKTMLIGGYGMYNDSTKYALATIYPLLMEYSQGDTLFLRADTIKTYMVKEMVKDLKWTASGYPEWQGKPVIKADSAGIWLDEVFFNPVLPLADFALDMLERLFPTKRVEEHKGPPVPQRLDPAEELRSGLDSVAAERIEEMPLPEGLEHKKTVTAVDTVPWIEKEFHVALAYHRARFFKQDMQGVADSIVVVEKDSMLYMLRKPIVWSGERQIAGNRIDVHFNDSTADWALLPESGFMSEHVGEEFYNQLAGTKMYATFANQTLRTLDVSGNVETVFLPQESDSTYNRMVNAESSYLTILLDSAKMERLKMWPEVSGSVTPLFLVKKAQLYLPKFRWWGSLRPVREWYGDRWHWADDLGEVPDALEEYLNAPSELGEPKSFPAQRPPETSGGRLPGEPEEAVAGIESDTLPPETEADLQREETEGEALEEAVDETSENIERAEEKESAEDEKQEREGE